MCSKPYFIFVLYTLSNTTSSCDPLAIICGAPTNFKAPRLSRLNDRLLPCVRPFKVNALIECLTAQRTIYIHTTHFQTTIVNILQFFEN